MNKEVEDTVDVEFVFRLTLSAGASPHDAAHYLAALINQGHAETELLHGIQPLKVYYPGE